MAPGDQEEQKKGIKWVDFTATKDAMYKAFRYYVGYRQKELHLNWIQLLAYLGGKYGGDFSKYRASDMETLVSELKDGHIMEVLTKDMKYYSDYSGAAQPVSGGTVGEFEIEVPKEENLNGERSRKKVWVRKYGLKSIFPHCQGIFLWRTITTWRIQKLWLQTPTSGA